MQQTGDWLDRAMAFVLGLLGTFIGLAIAWALIETLTPLRLHLGGSRGAVAALQGAISLAVAIWQGRRAGRHATSPKVGVCAPAVELGVRAPTAEDRAMVEAMIAGMTEQVRREEISVTVH